MNVSSEGRPGAVNSDATSVGLDGGVIHDPALLEFIRTDVSPELIYHIANKTTAVIASTRIIPMAHLVREAG
jgi:hypothetical protein